MFIPTIASNVVSRLFQQSNPSSSNQSSPLSPFQQLAQGLGATGSSSASTSSSSGLAAALWIRGRAPVLQRELNTLASEISDNNLNGAKQTLAWLRQNLQSSAANTAANWSQLSSQIDNAALKSESQNPGLSLFG